MHLVHLGWFPEHLTFFRRQDAQVLQVLIAEVVFWPTPVWPGFLPVAAILAILPCCNGAADVAIVVEIELLSMAGG